MSILHRAGLLRAPIIRDEYMRTDPNLFQLEVENACLKRMYAELSLVHYALKDVVEKKL